MESTLRKPQAGDMVIVLAKMKSGRTTEISGCVEEVSADYVYFALDSIFLGDDPDSDESPLETKTWRESESKPLRVGVRLDDMKPFDGTIVDEDAPCWVVKI